MSLAGVTTMVTGAGGFVGSHLVEWLLDQGARVRAFLRYTSEASLGNLAELGPERRAAVECVFGDIRDPGAVAEAMEGQEVVFHLAALIAIPYSYAHPREVVETNVTGTLNVLEAARRHSPRRVVHLSTSEVYGTAQFVPITELHPQQGQSPYSASKIAADRVAESYHRCFGVPVVTVRPFNIFGPRQSQRAVIPTIVSQALAGGPVRLGALTPTRDFTFVTDTAAGIGTAGHAAGVEGREVNLGSGREISVGDLARRAIERCGTGAEVVSTEDRLRPARSEVNRLVADNSRAASLLGWGPTVPLDDGLDRTIEWVRAHPERFCPSEYRR
ncbi:MAG: GDP-mannose 4,6-dehydratase [Actinomycetota bacterium]